MADSDLRSQESTHRAFVLFHNTTKRQVELFWIDYQGNAVSYGVMKADEKRKIDTFCTHPWKFVDPVTKQNLLVAGKTVFHPQVWYEGAIDLVKMMIRRQVARIHHPVRSLKEIAMEVVALNLPDTYTGDELNIPKCLVEDVIRVRKEIKEPAKPIGSQSGSQ